MAKTTIRYEVDLEAQTSSLGLAAYIDGVPIGAGDHIGLGHHVFRLEHPKAYTFTTNFSAWYGGIDFGQVKLRRYKGKVILSANPTASTVTITGHDACVLLTNASAWEGDLPTGNYVINARWQNTGRQRTITVATQSVTTAKLDFGLAALKIETEPSGARVMKLNGDTFGTTPLIIPELDPGRIVVRLEKNDYLPFLLDVQLKENSTNLFRTNLVNARYAAAIDQARSFAKVNNYEHAIAQAKAVLNIKPDDTEAAEIIQKMRVGLHISRALDFQKRNAFAEAREEAAVTLKLEPNQATAREIITQIDEIEKQVRLKQEAREARELADKQWSERIQALEHEMKLLCDRNIDASLFNTHQLTITNTIKNLAEGISGRFTGIAPNFEVLTSDWPTPTLMAMQVKQQWFGGLRKVLLAATETETNTCLVAYRVLEYETHLNVNVGNFFKLSDGQPPLIALPNQRERVAEGVRLIKERIAP
jgi:hypothetical protein